MKHPKVETMITEDGQVSVIRLEEFEKWVYEIRAENKELLDENYILGETHDMQIEHIAELKKYSISHFSFCKYADPPFYQCDCGLTELLNKK